jgi:hypothetical protein
MREEWRPGEMGELCHLDDSFVFLKGKPVRKASSVTLRRKNDDAQFIVYSPCILRLPDGLIHVLGAPGEDLDTDIWDVREKFEVLEIGLISTVH